MTPLQAIILGMIQGITEFLPVSSSGHLLIPELLFGWSEQGIVFDVAVHIATLLAVLLYFRRRIAGLVRAMLSSQASHDRRIGWWLVVSVVPVALVGVLDVFTEWARSTPLIIGWSFIIWGLVLGAADWYGKKNHRTQSKTTQTNIIWMSLAQVLALIPGTSRSGITMTAGLFSGLTKTAAAEISMLMAIPVIAAAGFKQIIDMSTIEMVAWSTVSIGFISAFLSAVVSIWCLLRLIEHMGYLPFVVYRVMVGAIILLLFV